MNLFVIILLLALGIILMVAELFLLPGISVAGIASALCLVLANFYIYQLYGLTACLCSSIATLLLFCWGVYKFMKSKTLKKMSLKSVIDGQVPSARHQVEIGAKGISITRLAEYGQAEIDGKVVEVRSIDGFIDPKTPIEVKRISGDTVMVAKSEE